jgi:hypothetical protein
MQAFWSTTDDETAAKFGNGWMLSVVVNRRFDYKCRLDVYEPFHIPTKDIDLEVVLSGVDEQLLKEIKDEIKEKVSSRPIVCHSGGAWRQGMVWVNGEGWVDPDEVEKEEEKEKGKKGGKGKTGAAGGNGSSKALTSGSASKGGRVDKNIYSGEPYYIQRTKRDTWVKRNVYTDRQIGPEMVSLTPSEAAMVRNAQLEEEEAEWREYAGLL